MTTDERPAFICTVCARVIYQAHVPPTAPHCSSCGASTKPNPTMAAKAGTVECAHCGNVETAYRYARCPECDTVYGTFRTRKVKA